MERSAYRIYSRLIEVDCLSFFFSFFVSFDRVVAKISAIEKDAGLNLPMSDNEEISKVS
jgi:hypothetical protein